MDEGRYVYCVTDGGKTRRLDVLGIGERNEVYTIPYRGISAVVSDTPLIACEPSEANVLAHERVVEEAMREHTVLPLKFGTIFKGEANVRKTLAKLYRELKSDLGRLEGKVELGVKVFWSPEAAISEIERTSKKVAALKEQIGTKTPGVAYLLRIKLENLVKEELNRQAEEHAAEIYNALKKLAVESKSNNLIGYMILNGAFLVGRADLDEFRSACQAVKRRYQDRGIELVFSGPWPPYNFVAIKHE